MNFLDGFLVYAGLQTELKYFLIWLIETFEIHNLQDVDLNNILNLWNEEKTKYFEVM